MSMAPAPHCAEKTRRRRIPIERTGGKCETLHRVGCSRVVSVHPCFPSLLTRALLYSLHYPIRSNHHALV
jgi:hypothetical protein